MFKDIQRLKAWESITRKTQQQAPARRRSHILPPASVAPATDDPPATSMSGDDAAGNDDVNGPVQHAERLLPNGDFYTGQWRHNVPHGDGKYLWTDGCMYEGEWRHGKTMGKGKFSWPSGATYEGEFKSGFMDGLGTYTSSLGDTYRGFWSLNLKHGQGKKCYANGDYYDGEWRAGLQDGHGRYIWKNGNEYVGEWRAGVINGRGTLVWTNGNRYDGEWEDGFPNGKGTFRWADGGLYIGYWSKEDDAVQQKGVYYPSPAATSPTARDPHAAFAADLSDCKVCPGETVFILPSQKTLNWSGIEENFLQKQAVWRQCKSNDGRPRRCPSADKAGTGETPRRSNGHNSATSGSGSWESNGDYNCDAEEGSVARRGEAEGEGVDESAGGRWLPIKWPPPEVKKQGETISKGHKNYDLMLNLQLGIRQVDRDCELLEQERIMDYSLLVGVHFREVSQDEHPTEGSGDLDSTSEATPRLSRADMDQFLCDPTSGSFLQSHAASAAITRSFLLNLSDKGHTWKTVPDDVKEFYWLEFQKEFTWNPELESVIKRRWLQQAAIRYSDTLSKWRERSKAVADRARFEAVIFRSGWWQKKTARIWDGHQGITFLF